MGKEEDIQIVITLNKAGEMDLRFNVSELVAINMLANSIDLVSEGLFKKETGHSIEAKEDEQEEDTKVEGIVQ